MSGRTFAIGDIHGCEIALNGVLSQIKPTAIDTLVLLGDIIDRGPNSARCIEILLGLKQLCNLVLVMGNHEEMLFEAFKSGIPNSRWLRYGGEQMVGSYGGRVQNIPRPHLDFLADSVPFHETDSTIFVHANLDSELPLSEQSIECLRWRHLTGFERPHNSGKRVICGHTPIQSGVPKVFEGWVAIDTGAYGGMFLTALNVDSDEVYQASQGGFTRGGVTLTDLV
jgi:serine/threonine protein phosphatase 1